MFVTVLTIPLDGLLAAPNGRAAALILTARLRPGPDCADRITPCQILCGGRPPLLEAGLSSAPGAMSADTGVEPVITRAGLSVLALVGVTVLLYWPSAATLWQVWRDGAVLLNHGYPVLFIAAILLVRAARSVPAASIAPSWTGLGILAVASFGWLLAIVAQVVAVHTAALPAILLAAVYAAFGRSIAVRVAFPILFIAVALPFWLDAQVVFQALTTRVSTWILALLGIPVLIEGDLVHVTAGTFRIAYGCSGVNFLVVSLTLSALYGHLFCDRVSDRLKLIGIAAFLAMAINWVRVASIIYVGNATDMESSLVHDHITYGWILYAVSLLPFFYIAHRIGHRPAPPAGEGQAHIATERPAGNGQAHATAAPRLPATLVLVATLLTLAVAPGWAYLALNRFPVAATASVALPDELTGWNGPDTTADPRWQPQFTGPSGQAQGRFLGDTGPVWMYANVYLSERQGGELIHFDNTVAGGMSVRADTVMTVDGADGEPMPIRQIETGDNGGKWLIWYWYEVAGRRETSEVRTKIRQAVATLLGDPAAGITAIGTTCVGRCEVARDRLQRFVQAGGTAVTRQAELN